MNGGPRTTTLVEYNKRFWIKVARKLKLRRVVPQLVLFEDRGTEMLPKTGFPVIFRNECEVASEAVPAALFARVEVANVDQKLGQERCAFDRNDEEAMRDKSTRAIIANAKSIKHARFAGQPQMRRPAEMVLRPASSPEAKQSQLRHFDRPHICLVRGNPRRAGEMPNLQFLGLASRGSHIPNDISRHANISTCPRKFYA